MSRSDAKGFTLIELMIVIAIISILAGIALPAYTQHVVTSRRTDAERELVLWAQALERNFSVNQTYGTGCTSGQPSGTKSNDYYTFSAAGVNCTATTFTLSAAPTTGTSQASDGTLTLNNTGTRTPADKWKY